MNEFHDNCGEIIEYDGYKARISYDVQDNLFVGEILDINDYISFHSKTKHGVMAAFRKCLGSYRNIKHKISILEK